MELRGSEFAETLTGFYDTTQLADESVKLPKEKVSRGLLGGVSILLYTEDSRGYSTVRVSCLFP